MAATGLLILWSILPRWDRFRPPGPEIFEHDEPQLFALLRDVAAEAEQEMPRHVYVDWQVNAAVANRGGLMGFGSRRIMILGLPLIQGLSVDELRAVVAHEFGHYRAGDVSLGPWIHKTHAAIARTLQGLGDQLVGRLFAWYAHMFLRLTRAVSRQQEFVADALSARVTRPDTVARTLTRVDRLASAAGAYWFHEVTPVIEAGYLPPVGSGFAAFLSTERSREHFARPLEPPSHVASEEPMDTHPSLHARLTALSQLPAATDAADGDTPAGGLLLRVDDLAMDVLRATSGNEAVERLERIMWSQVADVVIAPRWKQARTRYAYWLGRFRIEEVPDGHAAWLAAGEGLVPPEAQGVTNELKVAQAANVWAIGVGVTLLDLGWRIETGPGLPATLVRDDESVCPFDVPWAILEARMSATDWRQRCETLGLAARRLDGATSTTAAPPV